MSCLPNSLRFLCAAALLLFAANAPAGDLEARLTCPDQESAGSQVQIGLELMNATCTAINARVLSSVVGNSGENLAGIGVFGPFVAIPSVTVPAASEVYGGCQTGICEWGGTPCVTNADCPYCGAVTPGVFSLDLDVPPALPASLEGTVATLLIMTETDEAGTGKSDTNIVECFVDVQ